MAISIRLLQGDTVVVNVDAETWNRAFREALVRSEMIRVQNSEGLVVAINPQQVAYLEEVPEARHDPHTAAVPLQPEA